MMVPAVLVAGILILPLFVLYIFARRIMPVFYFGAIFIPTSQKRLRTMLSMAALSPGMRVIDIGSGDGRILIAAAEQGTDATGIEIDKDLVARSRNAVRKKRLEQRVHIHQKDLWSTDLASYDVIFVYAMPYMMKRLSEKIRREAGPHTKIISNSNRIPGIKLMQEADGVYCYTPN